MAGKSNRERVTLAQVAARAGVSTTTASVILSGREEGLSQFRLDTISRVRKCAERLGYRPNLLATSLSSDRSTFFALIILLEGPEEDSYKTHWDLWRLEGRFLVGIIKTAAKLDLHPIIAGAKPDVDPHNIRSIERVIAGGVFGTIARTPNPALEKHLRFHQLRQGHPTVVVFPRRLSKWTSNVIDVDNIALGQTVARLLERGGRTKWAVVHYKNPCETHRYRCQGFQNVADRLGVTVRKVQLPANVDELTAAGLVARGLRRLNADGVFALDFKTAVGSLLGCLNIGLKPGSDVSLVGCDTSLWQTSTLPRITSVDISWQRVGVRALEKLVELSQAGEARFDNVLLAPEITPGDTCPVPPDMMPPDRGPAAANHLSRREPCG